MPTWPARVVPVSPTQTTRKRAFFPAALDLNGQARGRQEAYSLQAGARCG